MRTWAICASKSDLSSFLTHLAEGSGSSSELLSKVFVETALTGFLERMPNILPNSILNLTNGIEGFAFSIPLAWTWCDKSLQAIGELDL